jgi:hypothetical protein
LAFGVWRLAFGVWRLAFGVWRLLTLMISANVEAEFGPDLLKQNKAVLN